MSTLGVTLGAMEISILISSVLYGVTSLQTFLYTERSFKDPRWLHIMVALIWLLETGHTVFTWILLYLYTITNYGEPTTIISTPWSLAYSLPFTALIGSIVQTFFAYRIRMLSGSLVIPIIAWCAAASRVGTGTTLAVVLFSSNTLTEFAARYQWLVTTHLTLDAAVDVMITTSLCYYLLRRKTTFQPTRRMIHRLVLYTVETGLATSTCAVITVICSRAMSDNLISYGIIMIYPRLFSNSLLTALNARQSLRRTGDTTSRGVWDTHGPMHFKDGTSDQMDSTLKSGTDRETTNFSQPQGALTIELGPMSLSHSASGTGTDPSTISPYSEEKMK